MSETFEEKLEELRKKDPGSLTEADRAFLSARRSYLQEHELEAFGITDEENKPAAITKADLQEQLTAKGIEFDPKATKADLQTLLDAQPKE